MSIFDDIINFPLNFVLFWTNWSCSNSKIKSNNQLEITFVNPKNMSYNIDTIDLRKDK